MMNNFQQQEMTRFMDRPRVYRRDKDGLNFAQEKEEQGGHGQYNPNCVLQCVA